ncbi:hypothetical protein [Neotabrizicola shimadae]|uniref:hypothetical protein n=1 Tax=Neotabrizicola shimadae TaxID=2807096 RepID=UPI002176DF39|nr:hypothetical protein [Neotabrizicola shimadae]
MDNEVKDVLTSDHQEIYDTLVARSYFGMFEKITGHLARVADAMQDEGRLTRTEARILNAHVGSVAATFRALSWKYLMTGRVEGPLPGRLTFDRHESGFPIAQELMVMAVDAAQAEKHLAGMASEAELKDRMIRQIVGDLTIPTQLQFALSQRLYYEALLTGNLFQARNDPDGQWLGEDEGRRFLLHWSVYDTQENLPIIYLMDVEEAGRRPLLADDRRWPQVRAHLMAQSVAGLKLLTIAQGFDTDFPDIQPKRLRRLRLGPMYSHAFTLQSGPISQVLANAGGPPDQDWALVWTVEDLVSERTEQVKDGWFSTTTREIWKLDPLKGAEDGTTSTTRMIILPERPNQVLTEMNPPGFRDPRRFVVDAAGRLVPQR